MSFQTQSARIVTRIAIALSLLAMLPSCSSLIKYNTKVHVADPSSADKLEAFDSYGSSTSVDHSIFKANNRSPFYTVQRSRKGYITDYKTIKQEGINPMLAVDAGIALIGGVLLATGSSTTTDSYGNTYHEASTGSTLGALLLPYGVLGVVLGHKTAFKNAMALEPMTELPPRPKDGMYLYVDKVGIKLESGKVATHNFIGLKNYQNNLTESGVVDEKKKVSDTFNVEQMERIDASTELNDMLKENGFIDTTNSMFRMSNNSNLLEGEVQKWDYNYIKGGAYSFQVTVKWTMKDNLSKESILSKTYTTTSDVIVSSSSNDLYRKGFVNALTKGMVQLMQDEAFAGLMTDKKVKFRSTVDGWSEIAITTGKYTSQKIGVSSKSVATVKTKEGHGSGVFISADGYLVTNLHVTGQQTDSLGIILADGSKLKGKVVRSNPVYDLSLVKVEGFKGNPINVSKSREVELGATVFAIGTPEDLELGQTVTRGIVSSKRNFGEVDYIQTDVSINRGNSGGALLNEAGELIGVVNAKIIGQGVEGVGFAIPSYYIPEALKVLLK